ncbi:MAG: efflux RND transporter permease subunit [Paludisphaera borealis]|uniref:efflux RND transporter permease subunit n=1 Tax=Paludisphaera borealis TaxID=1387353 RepID=UPI002849B949|nr:efflux RND transporter permease subunit [Paludisphaera borealis]MDR3620229.1 efflux RND transporter permease subunit [Paludisphaera borealis]
MTQLMEPETIGRATPSRGLNLISLARPYFGLIVLTAGLLSAYGVYSMFRMPSGIYPEVNFPRVVVIAQTPGLSVKDVEVAVTRPIEEVVSIVLGVERVRSKSVRGASELSVDFTPGTNMIQALNDVRARMAEVGAKLPPGTTTLTERQTPSVFPIISFVVTGGRNPSELHDYAYYVLRPRVSRVPDVSYATVQGGDVREIVVEVDPQALVSAGLSISDVADRLNKEHRLKAVGRLDRGTLQYQVLTDTLATDPLDLENIVVADKNAQPIRVKDLGKVTVSHEDRMVATRANGKDAVVLTVFRRLGGNTLTVSRELDAALADAAKNAPPGIHIEHVYDEALLVQTAIDNVRDAIFIGGALSVVVLLLFLRSVRATLIAALSIPLSLVISFVFLNLSGDTLNLMSLGGLAVAIGLIIDDTVVVIENIARHIAEGDRGDEAVDRASKEISGAVVGSTLTTILVFLPLAFIQGMVGQFFQSLSLALSVSLLVSMVVSLTIIPVLAARYLGRRPMSDSGPIYNFLADRYEGLLRIGLKFPRTTIALFVFAVVPLVWIVSQLETGFMPDMDEGTFVLDYQMPVGTSLEQTDRVMRRVEDVLLKTPDVEGYIRRTGAELGFFATESYTGDVLIVLKPRSQRRPMGEIVEELREAIPKVVPELETEFVPTIQDQVDDLAGAESPIEVKIFGSDQAELRKLATEVGEILEKISGVVDVNTNVVMGNPDIMVRPDSVQTARVGLSVMDVENQLNAALYGQVASTLPEQDRMTNIRVRYPDRVRYDRDRLAQLPISLATAATSAAHSTAAAGIGFVPLGQLATIRLIRSPNELKRENLQPVINVTASLDKRDLGSANTEIQAKLSELKFPPGYRWEVAGDYKSQQDSFASLLTVLIVSSALVFLLLGFQFKSLTLPILIFLAQPVSLASAMFALWITSTPLNISSFLGAILLIGLDVKNGIILIEYIDQLRAGGMPIREALLKAGRVRFRPILMTSLCTILGLAPLALGIGPGAQMQQPLAIAVIGGLFTNMLLTRLLIPVGYLVLKGDDKPAAV